MGMQPRKIPADCGIHLGTFDPRSPIMRRPLSTAKTTLLPANDQTARTEVHRRSNSQPPPLGQRRRGLRPHVQNSLQSRVRLDDSIRAETRRRLAELALEYPLQEKSNRVLHDTVLDPVMPRARNCPGFPALGISMRRAGLSRYARQRSSAWSRSRKRARQPSGCDPWSSRRQAQRRVRISVAQHHMSRHTSSRCALTPLGIVICAVP